MLSWKQYIFPGTSGKSKEYANINFSSLKKIFYCVKDEFFWDFDLNSSHRQYFFNAFTIIANTLSLLTLKRNMVKV